MLPMMNPVPVGRTPSRPPVVAGGCFKTCDGLEPTFPGQRGNCAQ